MKNINSNYTLLKAYKVIEEKTIEKIFMRRVCDNCGEKKDVEGGKSCSKGHFICHRCSKNHIHCPLCGHTLR